MTCFGDNPWLEANQRCLMAAVGVARARIELFAQGHTREENREPLIAAEASWRTAMEAMPAPAALETLCATFGLSVFERDVLVMCAGMELSSDFAALIRSLPTSGNRPGPTFSMALTAFPESHWSALTPSAPLRHWQLIELVGRDGLTNAGLRIDERVLHYLTGVQVIDERLQGLITPVDSVPELPPSRLAMSERLAQLWKSSPEPAPIPVVQLCTGDPVEKRAVTALACRSVGLRLYALRPNDLPTTAMDRDVLTRLWEREAILSRSALLFEADDTDEGDFVRHLATFLEKIQGIVVVTRPEPVKLRTRSSIRMDIPTIDKSEQTAMWKEMLGEKSASLNGQIGHLVSQFSLGLQGIRNVAASVDAALCRPDSNETLLASQLWEACRAEARPRMDDLAQRITPAATWSDLVLPETQLQTLREIAAQVRQRSRVYETWGFARKSSRGLGISALFAGPSGTGKTMAAEVLANELRLDLYHIDLSGVVSKYIGETEKNLRRVFDAAEHGGAILLFDEADAIFGKRSEVKDSHDRYANLEVSYLLQRIEAYRGLAILTTNMREALDAAFLRRLRFVMPFPFPDPAQRAEIWHRIIPANTPTEALDFNKLSRLNVSGGNIRNVALNAAFLAADENQPVRMTHLLRAARSEYSKLEKPLTASEIGGWI